MRCRSLAGLDAVEDEEVLSLSCPEKELGRIRPGSP